MDFVSKDYLPNTEVRIENLRNIINGRPVAILAAGPSIKELEERIEELKHIDICYFGLNNYSVQELNILHKIDKHMSVMMMSAGPTLDYINNIINFLNRDEDNMFISSIAGGVYRRKDIDFDLQQFISKYDKKLLFFGHFGHNSKRTVPNNSHPLHFTDSNSLLTLIQLAIIGKASKIILFGADGYCETNNNDCYYRQNDYNPNGSNLRYLIYDTNVLFNPIATIAIRNVYETYDLPPIEIVTCSENSFYTPFPKASYNDAFEFLLKNQKFNLKSDLRVPKLSIITPFVNAVDYLNETVESVSNQSYSNYEHIIVSCEDNDELQDVIQKYQNVRWISETNVNDLQAFEKGISVAKGEYIIYCPAGDEYLDPDWLNTCVEILETNPDISLVCGLPQHMLIDETIGQVSNGNISKNAPPSGKAFIYHWLKNKTLFPENCCVRKNVLKECLPISDSAINNVYKSWVAFNYKFNSLGYLPHFVNISANYSKIQNGEDKHGINLNMSEYMETYFKNIEQYKRKLIRRTAHHQYRNGNKELFPHGFSLIVFLLYDIGRFVYLKIPHRNPINLHTHQPIHMRFINDCLHIESSLKSPHKFFFLICEKSFDYWMAYRWRIFNVGAVLIYKAFKYFATKLWISIHIRAKMFYRLLQHIFHVLLKHMK